MKTSSLFVCGLALFMDLGALGYSVIKTTEEPSKIKS